MICFLLEPKLSNQQSSDIGLTQNHQLHHQYLHVLNKIACEIIASNGEILTQRTDDCWYVPESGSQLGSFP